MVKMVKFGDIMVVYVDIMVMYVWRLYGFNGGYWRLRPSRGRAALKWWEADLGWFNQN